MSLEPMWIWAIIAFALLAAEIGIGTMDVIWFGLSALCVAIIVAIFPDTSLGIQVTIFSVLSIGALLVWKRYFQSDGIDSNIGQAQGDEIGRTGTMSKACSPNQNGKITFTQGVMGSREWTAVSDAEIAKGQTATIIAIEGNALRVAPN